MPFFGKNKETPALYWPSLLSPHPSQPSRVCWLDSIPLQTTKIKLCTSLPPLPRPHFTKATLAEVTLRLSRRVLLLTTLSLKHSPLGWFSWQFIFPGFPPGPLVTLPQSHVQTPSTAGVHRSPRLAFSSHLILSIVNSSATSFSYHFYVGNSNPN